MYFYEVLIANKYAKMAYTYSYTEIIEKNTLIEVEFGKSICLGVVLRQIEANEDQKEEKTGTKTASSSKSKNSKNYGIKTINNVYDYSFSSQFLKFLEYCANYNLATIGSILEMALPSTLLKFLNQKPLPMLIDEDGEAVELSKIFRKGLRYEKILEKKKYEGEFLAKSLFALTENQLECANKIGSLAAKEVLFLHGVTGSGKTITTLEGIAKILAKNSEKIENHVLDKLSLDGVDFRNVRGKILIITPEISLSKMWCEIIRKRFGKTAFLYHHKLSDAYKYSLFNWAQSHEPGIVVGARSALFLPYENLQAIVIDEEHSSALKQDRYPYYHARDMAIVRSHFEKIPCVLVSATPSLETLYNISVGKYLRANITRTPSTGTANFRFVKQERSQILAPEIIKAIENRLEKGQQILLFLNRKGYAPYCICNSCSTPLMCAGCDLPKIFYSNNSVVCHKCGASANLPVVCPSCKANTTWKFHGVGVEKLDEYIKQIFPNHVFKVVTSDTKEIGEYIDDINNKKIDGLIATQVLAQGHDFKSISLVVIVDAHMGLNSPDFRVSEKVLQLWQQIRGRSGRHEEPGEIIVQALSEDNKFIKLFKDESAYELLMQERKDANWPPFTRCGFVIVKAKNEKAAREFFNHPIFTQIAQNGCEIYGPLYVGRQSFINQWRFLIKVPKNLKINEFMEVVQMKLLNTVPRKSGIKLEFEVDPYNFF